MFKILKENEGSSVHTLTSLATRSSGECSSNDQFNSINTSFDNGCCRKVRKAYTSTKQRQLWTNEEHSRFIEALKLYGRAWSKIKDHIGTKTVVQIRSHAQKFFCKIQHGQGLDECQDLQIPPPRPKRKPNYPYPRKANMKKDQGEKNVVETAVVPHGVVNCYSLNDLLRDASEAAFRAWNNVVLNSDVSLRMQMQDYLLRHNLHMPNLLFNAHNPKNLNSIICETDNSKNKLPTMHSDDSPHENQLLAPKKEGSHVNANIPITSDVFSDVDSQPVNVNFKKDIKAQFSKVCDLSSQSPTCGQDSTDFFLNFVAGANLNKHQYDIKSTQFFVSPNNNSEGFDKPLQFCSNSATGFRPYSKSHC